MCDSQQSQTVSQSNEFTRLDLFQNLPDFNQDETQKKIRSKSFILIYKIDLGFWNSNQHLLLTCLINRLISLAPLKLQEVHLKIGNKSNHIFCIIYVSWKSLVEIQKVNFFLFLLDHKKNVVNTIEILSVIKGGNLDVYKATVELLNLEHMKLDTKYLF